MGMEVVGVAPPLTIDRDIADQIVDILAESIAVMEAEFMPAERARQPKPEADRVTSAAELFERMPGRFDPALADGIDIVVQFALTGEGGGTWLVDIRGGDLSITTTDKERTDATLTLRATAADYVRIANGDLAGADAFTTQRLAIDGDLAQAATLGKLGLM
jgi:alkyl sulfatase BDS1-like metallo-beta-lactamase superfamily hydrolase